MEMHTKGGPFTRIPIILLSYILPFSDKNVELVWKYFNEVNDKSAECQKCRSTNQFYYCSV